MFVTMPKMTKSWQAVNSRKNHNKQFCDFQQKHQFLRGHSTFKKSYHTLDLASSLNITHIRAFKLGIAQFFTLKDSKATDLGPTMYYKKVE